LLDALRHRIAGLPDQASGGLTVDLVAPERLPELSPAVELAAYRIVTEALSNAFRHSDGRLCVVTIAGGGALGLEVWDDGTPPARWRPGVGVHSMTDRAEELGGTASAGPTTTGWAVRSRLPIGHPG
jgi:signal transduction histidine kinase